MAGDDARARLRAAAARLYHGDDEGSGGDRAGPTPAAPGTEHPAPSAGGDGWEPPGQPPPPDAPPSAPYAPPPAPYPPPPASPGGWEPPWGTGRFSGAGPALAGAWHAGSYPPPPVVDASARRQGIAALVVGIVSIPFAILVAPALVALCLAITARRRMRGDRHHPGRGEATAGLVLSIISLAIAAISIIALVAYLASGPIDVEHLHTGDCIDADTLGGPVFVDGQSCTARHQYEVFAISSVQRAVYPGDDEVRSYADTACRSLFNLVFRTGPGEHPDLRIDAIVPTARTWARYGQRRVVCLLAHADGTPLTRPIPRSAR